MHPFFVDVNFNAIGSIYLITFLNLDEQFIKTASEMELILFIKDKYEHFKRMNR